MFVYPPSCRLGVREELAENDLMTQYANASATVANARRRQNAVHALIQEGLANGGLVQLEEFEDPVEDAEFNRMNAEMQAAIAWVNAEQDLPGAAMTEPIEEVDSEEEEEAGEEMQDTTPPQTPPQT